MHWPWIKIYLAITSSLVQTSCNFFFASLISLLNHLENFLLHCACCFQSVHSACALILDIVNKLWGKSEQDDMFHCSGNPWMKKRDKSTKIENSCDFRWLYIARLCKCSLCNLSVSSFCFVFLRWNFTTALTIHHLQAASCVSLCGSVLVEKLDHHFALLAGGNLLYASVKSAHESPMLSATKPTLGFSHHLALYSYLLGIHTGTVQWFFFRCGVCFQCVQILAQQLSIILKVTAQKPGLV